MKENEKAWETALCGGLAGLVSRFFIAPLDVLKIRMQLSSGDGGQRVGGKSRYGSTVGSLRTILGEEGVRALWKGNVPAEWLYVTYSATQFLTYSSILTPITEATGIVLGTFIAGAVAGTVATTVTYPFDLLRTRFAIHHQKSSSSSSSTGTRVSLFVVTRDVVRREGIRGMYRGLGASITQIIPYMGLLFGTYEPSKRTLQGLGITRGWEDVCAGFIAGTLSKTGVFPLDLIRKRIQVQGPSRLSYVLDVPLYSSSLSCAAQIWRREGLRGFYKGLPLSLLKSAPSSAITLWTFQQSHHLLCHVQRKLGFTAQ